MNWINVKDSLPELNVDGSKVFDYIDVIATDGIHVCTCEFQSGWYCMEQWFAWGNYNQIPKSQITHWQYLPKPPLEGGLRMNPFKIGDKVLCVSSDGMDGLKVGEAYTVNFIDWINEVGVEEVIGFVHFTKRFKLIEEEN